MRENRNKKQIIVKKIWKIAKNCLSLPEVSVYHRISGCRYQWILPGYDIQK